jgi:hypothetical protein
MKPCVRLASSPALSAQGLGPPVRFLLEFVSGTTTFAASSELPLTTDRRRLTCTAPHSV